MLYFIMIQVIYTTLIRRKFIYRNFWYYNRDIYWEILCVHIYIFYFELCTFHQFIKKYHFRLQVKVESMMIWNLVDNLGICIPIIIRFIIDYFDHECFCSGHRHDNLFLEYKSNNFLRRHLSFLNRCNMCGKFSMKFIKNVCARFVNIL